MPKYKGGEGGVQNGPKYSDVINEQPLKSKNYLFKKNFLHISSSYAKILGGKLFRTREFPRSWSKAKDGGKEEKKKREKNCV